MLKAQNQEAKSLTEEEELQDEGPVSRRPDRQLLLEIHLAAALSNWVTSPTLKEGFRTAPRVFILLKGCKEFR